MNEPGDRAMYNDWMPRQEPEDSRPSRPRRRHRGRWFLLALLFNIAIIVAAGFIIANVAWRVAPFHPGNSSSGAPNGPSGVTPGSGSSGFSAPGVGSSGSSSSNSSGGPSDAASIARDVDAGLVDINTTLNYQNEEAAGTGMVLTSTGEVLTNNHVIEGATSINATDIGNGRTYSVRVIGYDRTNDVALLQLNNASDLKTVHLGNSSTVRVGEAVVGIGNAGGSGGTPSYAGGSVTGLNQSITASDSGDGTSEQLAGLIGTNAGIEPGDSGGPLVNTAGAVLGMDTAASAGFQLGAPGTTTTQAYSIPINEALAIAQEIKSGKASAIVHVGPTAFLGVQVTSPGANNGFGGFGGFGSSNSGSSNSGSSNSGSSNSGTTSGAEIVQVFSGSPASLVGLAAGDTITSFDNQTVSSPNSLTEIVEREAVGDSVPLRYVGPTGQLQSVTIRLGSGPPQ